MPPTRHECPVAGTLCLFHTDTRLSIDWRSMMRGFICQAGYVFSETSSVVSEECRRETGTYDWLCPPTVDYRCEEPARHGHFARAPGHRAVCPPLPPIGDLVCWSKCRFGPHVDPPAITARSHQKRPETQKLRTEHPIMRFGV